MTDLKYFALVGLMALFLLSCSKGFQGSSQTDQASQGSQGDPTNPPNPPQPPVTPPDEPFQPEALAWEQAKPGTVVWSKFVFNLIQTEAKDLLTAQDMPRFCPKYRFLSTQQKVNVAGQLIAGIVSFESQFDPLRRFPESNLGTDPVTNQPVYSEGLMQLSYQDILGYPFCQFKWSQDKNLSATDPKKTILDPYKNLYCGVRILALQVKRHGLIVIDSGAYWSVIKENGHYQKIDAIEAIVTSLKMCQ
jgi:hypothetical protein